MYYGLIYETFILGSSWPSATCVIAYTLEKDYFPKISSASDAVIRLDGWYLINPRITDITGKRFLSCALVLNEDSSSGSSPSSSKISKALKGVDVGRLFNLPTF